MGYIINNMMEVFPNNEKLSETMAMDQNQGSWRITAGKCIIDFDPYLQPLGPTRHFEEIMILLWNWTTQFSGI